MLKPWLKEFQPGRISWFHNFKSNFDSIPPDDKIERILPKAEGMRARSELRLWDDYKVTPLHQLDDISSELNIGKLWLKDEGFRFDLGSFKALGGAYAVYRVLETIIQKNTGQPKITTTAMRSGQYQEILSKVTVVTATDGNHGKSVAWGAAQFGCASKIYLHADVSKRREDAIAAYGCDIVRVSGTYDDSVRQADIDAVEHGWHVVSDTSYPGYMDIPSHVMQGYTMITAEVADQISGDFPTHIFVPGGVGGIAAAIAVESWRIWSNHRPRIIVVEPESSDCLYQSAIAGTPSTAQGNLNTIMACLSAGEPSLLAWDILNVAAHDFMILADPLIAPTMIRLSELGIVSGESGAAALAALTAAAVDPSARLALAIDEKSRILVLSTEGATDSNIYGSIVGKQAEDVLVKRLHKPPN